MTEEDLKKEIDLLKNCIIELQQSIIFLHRKNEVHNEIFADIGRRLDKVEAQLSDEDPAVDDIPVEIPSQPQTPMQKQPEQPIIIREMEDTEERMFI